ncbi:hypothetical protein GCM10007426_42820 [Alloalcanivorax dieselolei]|nr:hypothetical protein GCM10007426_42820 [Alloalcanivorax dieselolei]
MLANRPFRVGYSLAGKLLQRLRRQTWHASASVPSLAYSNQSGPNGSFGNSNSSG